MFTTQTNNQVCGPALLDEIRTAPLSPKSILSQFIPSRSDICVPLPGARLDGLKSLGSNYILRGPNNRGEAEPVAPKFASIEDLNWSDWDEVLENKRLLNQGHRILLGIAEKKKDFFPEGFECGNYFDNLLPIICGGYAKADKIVYCGNNNLKGYKVPCDQWTLCSKCAYLTKAIELKEPYETAWQKLCALDRSHAKEVNLAMRNFLDAFGAAGSGINKRVYMGNLMSQSKSFIGVPAKGRPSVIKREEYKASKAKGKRGKRKKVKATRR